MPPALTFTPPLPTRQAHVERGACVRRHEWEMSVAAREARDEEARLQTALAGLEAARAAGEEERSRACAAAEAAGARAEAAEARAEAAEARAQAVEREAAEGARADAGDTSAGGGAAAAVAEAAVAEAVRNERRRMTERIKQLMSNVYFEVEARTAELDASTDDESLRASLLLVVRGVIKESTLRLLSASPESETDKASDS